MRVGWMWGVEEGGCGDGVRWRVWGVEWEGRRGMGTVCVVRMSARRRDMRSGALQLQQHTDGDAALSAA